MDNEDWTEMYLKSKSNYILIFIKNLFTIRYKYLPQW